MKKSKFSEEQIAFAVFVKEGTSPDHGPPDRTFCSVERLAWLCMGTLVGAPRRALNKLQRTKPIENLPCIESAVPRAWMEYYVVPSRFSEKTRDKLSMNGVAAQSLRHRSSCRHQEYAD